MLKKSYIPSIIIVGGMFLSCLLSPQENSIFRILNIFFGTLYIFYLPGYYLAINFFSPKTQSQISRSETIILSIVLSICSLPLILLLLNMIHFPLTQINIFLIGLVFLGMNVLYFYRKELLGR